MQKVSVASLVERAVEGGRKRVISVPDLVSDVRQSAPWCEHTDEELTELVAVIAIARSCNLYFGRAAFTDAS